MEFSGVTTPQSPIGDSSPCTGEPFAQAEICVDHKAPLCKGAACRWQAFSADRTGGETAGGVSRLRGCKNEHILRKVRVSVFYF